jgi:sporulation protein YlmC with PRC-barrel domain
LSHREINSNEIKGKEVVGPLGSVIGKATGVNFDPVTWQISSLQVSLDTKVAEQLGIKHTLERIGIRHTEMPLKASFVGQIGDKILLKASRDELVKYVTEIRIDDTTKQIKYPTS